MTTKTYALAILSLIFPLLLSAQSLEGYVYQDESNAPLHNATVEVLHTTDSSLIQTTTTDVSGHYAFVDLALKLEAKLAAAYRFSYANSTLHILRPTISEAGTVRLISLSGKVLTSSHYAPGMEQLSIDLSAYDEQIIIYSDAHYTTKLYLSEQGTRIVSKSATTDALEVLVRAYAQDSALYQAYVIHQSLSADASNRLDIYLEPWPTFLATIGFSLQDKYDNKVNSTTITLTNMANKAEVYATTTNENGEAQITGINIPANPENKLIPDSIDFEVSINENEYLKEFKDTLYNITNGDININYHNLSPKQQEFIANITNTVTNKRTGEAIENANVKSWTKGNNDTLNITTNSAGEVNYNVDIAAQNEITPDTAMQYIEVSGDNLETKLDSMKVSEGSYDKSFVMSEVNIPRGQAYFWRAFEPEIAKNGTFAKVIVKNDEMNYNDTIFDVEANTWWQDTVPVNLEGKTDYTITYIPKTAEGEIPHHDLTKIVSIENNEQSIDYDRPQALAQQVTLKGAFLASDTDEPMPNVDIVFYNDNGSVDSIRSLDGTYKLGPYPIGTTGKMNIHIPESNPESENYFSYKEIPVGGEYISNAGTVAIPEDGVFAMEDSVLTYNAKMLQNIWVSPENDTLDVNPAHLKLMQGSNFNLPWALWGEQREYIKATSTNTAWPEELGDFIERKTGVPYKVIIIDELPENINVNVTSLDSSYLETIRGNMVNVIDAKYGVAGYTIQRGTADLENIGGHTGAEITLTAPQVGNKGSPNMFIEGMREKLLRNGTFSEISPEYYKSYANYSMPYDLDTTNIWFDYANTAILYDNMSDRVKGEIGTGFGTIRPSNDEDYYNPMNQSVFYSQERWKHWDTTNMTERNRALFE